MQTKERADIQGTGHTPIEIAFPEVPPGTQLELRISVGACKLYVKPAIGATAALWATGDYDDPTRALPIGIEREGNRVRIHLRWDFLDHIELIDGVPRLNLFLGTRYQYALTIDGGAMDMHVDLGGLPITRLELSHGANASDLDFSAPNPVPMSLLKVGLGAGEIKARNLANANFEQMAVGGGAAGFKLDFGGTLQRDAQVSVDTAMAAVELRVPPTTPAKIVSVVVLGGAQADDGFVYREGAYWTPAALEHRAPMLKIHNSVTLGGITLHSR